MVEGMLPCSSGFSNHSLYIRLSNYIKLNSITYYSRMMKRIIWIFCSILIGTSGLLYAQDEPALLDTSQVEEVIVEPVKISQTITIDRITTDEKINEGFAKFGNPVSAIIFYAPQFGEDVITREVGVGRPDPSFYETPPFTLTYTKGDAPAFGKVFVLGGTEEGGMSLSFPTEVDIPLGQEVDFEGGKLTISQRNYNQETDELELAITYSGDEAKLADLALKSQSLELGVDASALSEITLGYTRTVPVAADGSVSVEDFNFQIQKNPESQQKITPANTYSFQVNKVQFLPIVVIVLLTGAIIFTLYFGFVNIRRFPLAINVVRGAYEDPNEKGEVSHFQALTAALSGTVGLGNIAGVAIAISIGGAGATFWMIMAGLLGMSSKFAECTLGVKYRTIDAKGEVSGGPMYYLSRGLEGKGLGVLGKVFAGFFAVMCIGGSFGGGNMFQVNQAYKQFSDLGLIDMDGWLFGVIMAALVAVVIIGGIKSIANVTDKIVPIMVGIYVAAALIILGMNIGDIPRAFGEIISGAFAPTAVAGGFIGVLIQGMRRAAFSNEAGVGSASIAHSAVKTNHPASEGIVALLEPFIDTVVVCTMTALVIIITDNHLDPNASDGVALTSQAFASQIPFFDYILAIAVILFAFSTMITWSYYGLKAWTYLFGGSRIADIVYKVLFCTFVVIGAAATLGAVTDFSDAMIFAMAFPNIFGVLILMPEVREELNKYLQKIKSGEIVRVK